MFCSTVIRIQFNCSKTVIDIRIENFGHKVYDDSLEIERQKTVDWFAMGYLCMASNVQIVNDSGNVNWNYSDNCNGVRPFGMEDEKE